MSAESKVRGHLKSDRIPRGKFLPELWKLLAEYQIIVDQKLRDEIRATNDDPNSDSKELKALRRTMWAGKNFGLQVRYVGLLLKYFLLKNLSLTGADAVEIYGWLDPNRPPGPGPRLP